MSEQLWSNERIRKTVLDHWPHERYERHDAIGHMIEVRDEMQERIEELEAENARLCALLPDAETLEAIQVVVMHSKSMAIPTVQDSRKEGIRLLLVVTDDEVVLAAIQEHDPTLIGAWKVLAGSDKTPEEVGDLIGKMSGNPEWGQSAARMVRYLRAKGEQDE